MEQQNSKISAIKLCAIYIRTSPHTENAELTISGITFTDPGSNAKMQESECGWLAQELGFTVYKVYRDLETPPIFDYQKQLQELIADARKGMFKNIVALNQDCLFKYDNVFSASFFDFIHKSKINIFYAMGGFDITDPDVFS